MRSQLLRPAVVAQRGLSPDATAVALWFERNHRPHWLLLSLLAGPCASAGLLSNPGYPQLLFEARTFNSLGFAVRREEWYWSVPELVDR